MNTVKGIFSRKSDEWCTPTDLFNAYNDLYNFNLDAASTHENALCDDHFTIEENGLERSWQGKRVWCNPPYSNVKEWVDKAIKETTLSKDTIVVMLLPSRTDTAWFHKLLGETSVSIKFIRGRLRFNGCNQNAPFPSIIVTFNRVKALHYLCKTNLSAVYGSSLKE